MLTLSVPGWRAFAIALACGSALLLAACGGQGGEQAGGAAPAAPAGAIRMKVAHTLPPETHCHKGLIKFKELLEAKAPGRFEIQLFHSGQLGDSADLLGRLKTNSVQVCLTAAAPLSNFDKKLMLADLPYLFPDAKTAERVLDGDIGQRMAQDLPAKAGIRVLAYWVSGFRSVFSAKKLYQSPADFQGTNIRVMETPAHIAFFNALGANARPMPFSEVFTALQQGNVDAAENAPNDFYTSGFQAVCKNFSLTQHVYTAIPLSISEKFYQSLPDDLKQAVAEAATEARDYERKIAEEMNNEAITQLKAKGVTVEAVDPAPFRAIAEKTYPQFENEIGKDLLAAAMAEVHSAS